MREEILFYIVEAVEQNGRIQVADAVGFSRICVLIRMYLSYAERIAACRTGNVNPGCVGIRGFLILREASFP